MLQMEIRFALLDIPSDPFKYMLYPKPNQLGGDECCGSFQGY